MSSFQLGITYDVLILDACGADEDAMVCPVEAFLSPEMVSKMINALKPTGKQPFDATNRGSNLGVLVVNVLSVTNPEGSAQKVGKVRTRLTRVWVRT